MASRISLADLAAATGYTTATISLALRNRGRMSRSTRAKIKRVARRLNYRPNPLLASLASKRFAAKERSAIPLAYIHFPGREASDEGSARHLIKFGQEHGRKLGYQLHLYEVDQFTDGAHATRLLFHQGVLGILVPHRFSLDRLPGMDWGRFAVVGWGESSMEADLRQPPLHRAAVDHFGSVLRAWEETRKRGYRRIGFALYELSATSTNDQSRWAAAHYCLQQAAARERVPILLSKPREEGTGLARWMRRHRPEAVIGFHFWMGAALRAQGFRIPEDVGFVSLHKDVHDGFFGDRDDQDSGMHQPEKQCIMAAVELLDQQLRYHQYGFPSRAHTLMIHSTWMEGETLPVKNEIAAGTSLPSLENGKQSPPNH